MMGALKMYAIKWCRLYAVAMFFAVVSLGVMPSTASARSIDEGEIREFFANFTQLEQNFEISLAKLYANDAIIDVHMRQLDGRMRLIQLNGTEWKNLIARTMHLAKAAGDKSTYKNIEISIIGDGAKIKATRYSLMRCYTDDMFYLIMQKKKSGKIIVVKEVAETQEKSNC